MAFLPAAYGFIVSKMGPAQTKWRWILAGPVAFVVAILLMATLPLMLPSGNGGINNLVIPVILFPLIWATFCIWPVASEHLEVCAFWYLSLTAACLLTLILNFVL